MVSPAPFRAARSLLGRLPEGSAGVAGTVAVAALVLSSLSALHLFEVRVDPAPELPPSPSPWVVDRAAAKDDAACQLSLRVREGGDDVDGAKVSVQRLDRGLVAQRFDAKTDAKGTHRIIDLAPGFYDVTVDVDGRALNGTPTFACDAAGKRAFFDVDVVATDNAVAGVVTGRRRQPLPMATVAIWQEDSARSGLSGVVRVRADDSGRFFARLPAGKYVAQVTANEHFEKKTSFTVSEGETALNVALAFSPAVRGVVVDELGAPIVDAVVAVGGAFDPRAKGQWVKTDEAGRFTLPIVAGQDLSLTARGDGRVARALLGIVDNVDAFQQVRLVASAGRTVSGVVYTTSGDPLAFGAVHYRVKSVGLEGEVPTDGQGRFLLDGMPAEEDVEVWAAGNAAGAWGAQVATPQRSQLALTFVAPAY